MEVITDARGVKRAEFASLADFRDTYFAQGGPSEFNEQRLWGPADWRGQPDDPEAFLREGFMDESLQAMAATASAELKTHAELVERELFTETEHVAGVMVNMSAYMAGDPYCMLMPITEMLPKDTPVITVVLSCCASGSVGHAELERRGIYALTLVRALQAGGYSVDLWVEWRTENAAMRIHAMRPGDVLSDAQLLALAVHRAWQREYAFAGASMAVGAGNRFHGFPAMAKAEDYVDGAIITATHPVADGKGVAAAVRDTLVKAGILHMD